MLFISVVIITDRIVDEIKINYYLSSNFIPMFVKRLSAI